MSYSSIQMTIEATGCFGKSLLHAADVVHVYTKCTSHETNQFDVNRYTLRTRDCLFTNCCAVLSGIVLIEITSVSSVDQSRHRVWFTAEGKLRPHEQYKSYKRYKLCGTPRSQVIGITICTAVLLFLFDGLQV